MGPLQWCRIRGPGPMHGVCAHVQSNPPKNGAVSSTVPEKKQCTAHNQTPNQKTGQT